jgi:serine phosphatase RsbU (regulator of sigma subunit)
MKGPNDSVGVNYLELCAATIGKETEDARNVAAGSRSVIRGETKEFLYDYPCHGPDGRHFFYLRSIRVAEKEPIRVVVSHEDITALIFAEEALRKRERERDRLRHSLELAREIQQILLPKDNPKIDGLEIAAKSIYCDETGGDYFDFIKFKKKREKLGVVVGDVAGHEPAILCYPVMDDFFELQGAGMALGVDKGFPYERNQKENFSSGSIVVLATDGVWEARNKSG